MKNNIVLLNNKELQEVNGGGFIIAAIGLLGGVAVGAVLVVGAYCLVSYLNED